MRPRDGTDDDDQGLPVEGLEVEETQDEDTIRRFIRDWRKRVSEEYARSILEADSKGPPPPSAN
jgi:hypothetical protein